MGNQTEEAERRTESDARPENARLPAIRMAATTTDVIAFVGKGVEFKGVISYSGTVRIDGRLDGEIQTDGILLVGKDAVITAKISAGIVISSGHITGDITAREKVNLNSPAVLNGSVTSPLLSIDEGVLFTGTLIMTQGETDLKDLTDAARNGGLGSLRLPGKAKAANG
jgi:cytoskeletal protein CcmA (bactofilin family)